MCVIIFVVFGIGFLNSRIYAQLIPTKQEQTNLLVNVQEVFEQVKLLTREEANATDYSVNYDVGFMVKRAEYILELLKQVMLLLLAGGGNLAAADRTGFRMNLMALVSFNKFMYKFAKLPYQMQGVPCFINRKGLSCTSNSVCMQEFRSDIQQLAQEGSKVLETCIHVASEAIEVNSASLRNVTEHAIGRGELFLESLENCSKKAGLAIISCYRTIIVTENVAVKNVLLRAIEAHRKAHFKAIDIRNVAGVCVDNAVTRYRGIMEKKMQESQDCF